MATTGTPDNNQSFIKRAGNVSATNITNVAQGGGPRIFNPAPADGDGRIVSRDTEAKLGSNLRRANPGQLYYSHERRQAASGYNIHGQPIEAAVATTTTFANDTANDDNGRTDAGTWTYRRSNNNTSVSYPLKIQ